MKKAVIIFIFVAAVLFTANNVHAATSLSPNPAGRNCNVVIQDDPGREVKIYNSAGGYTNKKCTTSTASGPENGKCQINLQGLSTGVYIAGGSSQYGVAITSGGACCEDRNSNNKCDALENLGTGCCETDNACHTNEQACIQNNAYWHEFGRCDDNACVPLGTPAGLPSGAPGNCNLEEHGICVTENQVAEISGSDYDKQITLEFPEEVNADNTFCFLTNTRVGKLKGNDWTAGCELYRYNDEWRLKAYRANQGSKPTGCAARCIYWRDDIQITRDLVSVFVKKPSDNNKQVLTNSATSLCGLIFNEHANHRDKETDWSSCMINEENNKWVVEAERGGGGISKCKAACISWTTPIVSIHPQFLEAKCENGCDGAYSEEINGPSSTNSACFLTKIMMRDLNADHGTAQVKIGNTYGNWQANAWMVENEGIVISRARCITWQHTTTPEPNLCGNGVVDSGEQCDCGSDGTCTPQELNSQTCESQTTNPTLSGTLSCYPRGHASQCTFDRSGCTTPIAQACDRTRYPTTGCPADTICEVAPRRVILSATFESDDTSEWREMKYGGSNANPYPSTNAKRTGANSFQFNRLNDQGEHTIETQINVDNGAKYTVEAWVLADTPDFAKIYGKSGNNVVGSSAYQSRFRYNPDARGGWQEQGWEKLQYTFTASGTTHKVVLSVNGAGIDAYFDDVTVKKHEEGCFSPCSLQLTTSVIQKGDGCTEDSICDIGDKVNVNVRFKGDLCPLNPIVQIDAKSSDRLCDIQHTGGTLQGIDVECNAGNLYYDSGGSITCTGKWTIQDIPASCINKRVDATAAAIYKNSIQPSNRVARAGYIPQSSFFIFTSSPTTPRTCGDGIVQAPNDAGVNEQCDGTILNNKRCQDVTSPVKYGTLSCKPDCTFDKTQCTLNEPPVAECGDNVTSHDEQCDDRNVMSGDGCSSSCVIEYCGDGIVNNRNEQCDGTNLNGKTCTDVGRGAGSGLACYPNASGVGCTFDLSACPRLCTDDGSCDAATEDTSCADCRAMFTLATAETTPSGVKFRGTFNTAVDLVRFITCKGSASLQACVNDYDMGDCGASGPCLCSSSVAECNLLCINEERQPFYLYAEAIDIPTSIKMKSEVRTGALGYTCPVLRIDEINNSIALFRQIHHDAAVAWASLVTRGETEKAGIFLQIQILARNEYLALQRLIDRYNDPADFVTAQEISQELQTAAQTLADINSLREQYRSLG